MCYTSARLRFLPSKISAARLSLARVCVPSFFLLAPIVVSRSLRNLKRRFFAVQPSPAALFVIIDEPSSGVFSSFFLFVLSLFSSGTLCAAFNSRRSFVRANGNLIFSDDKSFCVSYTIGVIGMLGFLAPVNYCDFSRVARGGIEDDNFAH